MTTLERVYFNAPTYLHGRLMREVTAGARHPDEQGTLSPQWELHLHAAWQCVVVVVGEACELVPLFHVRSMRLAAREGAAEAPASAPASEAPSAPAPELVAPKPLGRPRSKKLQFVRD